MPIYERIIIIIPYKAPDMVRQIQDSFNQINMSIFNLENINFLNTKQLTNEERNGDYLSGFELIDSEMRLFIIEGMGGKGNSIDKFYNLN